MPIITSPLDLRFPDYFLNLQDLVQGCTSYLKLEGFEATGSIKIKSALYMIEALERQGLAVPGNTTIVESSSGNLGIALSLVCLLRNYRFICVTDPNIPTFSKHAIEAYGGQTIVIDKRDKNGGYLENRISFIRQLIQDNPGYIWLNQYSNAANKHAHAELTAQEILGQFPRPDYLFVGTGTTGTAMGLAECFLKRSPHTKIIAVEPVGSVTFDDTQRGKRLIPGIGTSRKPELADAGLLHDVVYVSEPETIRCCHMMVRRCGFLLGGSSGSVIAAMQQYAGKFKNGSQVLGISPDFGDRYIDTVYSGDWVARNFGKDFFNEHSIDNHASILEVLTNDIPSKL